jgi:8-oxo-dGTP diphosphatase
MLTEMTVCFLIRCIPTPKILLGLKKSGFGAGKITGIGGKVEAGETCEAGAARELLEETGVWTPPDQLERVGNLTFLFPAMHTWDGIVHVFLAKSWTGEPGESSEIAPLWCSFDQIPYNQMWDDARYWLPLILDGNKIQACFVFNEDNQTVNHFDIKDLIVNRTNSG